MRSPSINTWILLPIIVYPLNHVVPCESPLCIPESLQGCLAFYQIVLVLAGNSYLWASRWSSWALAILSLALSSALLFPSLFLSVRVALPWSRGCLFYIFCFLPLIPYLRSRSKSSVNKVGWKPDVSSSLLFYLFSLMQKPSGRVNSCKISESHMRFMSGTLIQPYLSLLR